MNEYYIYSRSLGTHHDATLSQCVKAKSKIEALKQEPCADVRTYYKGVCYGMNQEFQVIKK